MSEYAKHKKKLSIQAKYRQILGMPNLTDSEIEEFRKPVILLAETICEHVWGKKFY
ncbi:MAG: hypothetical protein ABFD46_02845 [Armatimonadota bacterium]